MSFSRVFPSRRSTDIGPNPDTLLEKPSFFNGVTVACFHLSGNIFNVIHLLKWVVSNPFVYKKTSFIFLVVNSSFDDGLAILIFFSCSSS